MSIAVAVGTTSADDWPQWRGGDFSSTTSEKNLPVDFDQQWRVEMPGSAGSSPIVIGDRVFVTSIDGDDMLLLCVVDGKVAWQRKLEGSNQRSRDGANSASASPCSDGEQVWAMMGNGALACFTLDGEPVWSKNLQDVYGKFDIQFGMSSTPVLYKGNLYLALMHGSMRSKTPSVGQVISLDAKTGKENWLHLRKTDGIAENKHSYASPTIYQSGDLELLVTHGADYVIAHSLKDGSEVWRCGGINKKGPSYNPFLRFVASPACSDGYVITPSAKKGPVLAVNPNQKGDLTSGDTLHWRIDRGTPDVATPLIYDGIVYLAGERGELTCLDLKTGDQLSKKRQFSDKHRSTPVAGDGKIYIADRKGTVLVFQAGEKQDLLSKHEIGEETTASPAISDGRIYIRTFDALYCFGNNK
ncbi:MAG: PQQ-binding-like beta-propeller repeat protein [Planctomycetota bacterium]